jgi:hypothetical protein
MIYYSLKGDVPRDMWRRRYLIYYYLMRDGRQGEGDI